MRPRLRVAVGRDTVRAEIIRRGAVVWAGEAPHAGPTDLAETIAQLAGEPAVRGVRDAEVSVDGPAAQLRRLEGLPPVSRRALVALVAHQQKRFFRRNGKPLVTGAAWQRPARWWVRPTWAEAGALDEAWGEAIVRGLGSAGLVAVRMQPAGSCPGLCILPPLEVAARHRRAIRAARWWCAAAAVLWVAAGAVRVYRLRDAARKLDAELARSAPVAEAVRRARAPYDEGLRTLALIAREEAAAGAALEGVAGIAAALPDSAVITALTIDSTGTGTIGGLARDANQVIAALERAAAVAAPQIDGIVSREAFGGREWDRFSVTFGSVAR